MALNDTPLAAQTLAQTQNPIRVNFQTIDTAFSVNHVSYGIADQGKHKFLQLPEQGVAPTTAVNEAGLYSAVGAVSGVTELVFRRESNGTTIPFTESLQAANGWTRLPSGLLLQWGTSTTNAGTGNAGVTVNFPIAFTTAVYNVQLTATNNGNNTILLVLKTVTNANFTLYSRSGNDGGYTSSNFYFFAVGI